MAVVSLASFKEAREKKEIEDRKYWKRAHYRYLGGTVHIAHHHHSCDRCIFPILPGDQYRRDVYANNIRYAGNRKHLRIERSHWPQCYGPSEEEDRRIRDEIEREREEERAAERNVA